MAGLMLHELPDNVADVVRTVARYLEVHPDELFVADHEHEELSEGAFSIAYEGRYEWPSYFTEAVRSGPHPAPVDLFLSAGTGWYLAVYPDADR